MDSKTSIQEIRDQAALFRDERDWKQFHNPKDLAAAISIEAGELMELFLWQDKEQIDEKIQSDPQFLEKIKKELADVIITSTNFANGLDIDISEVVKEKIEENRKKYPVDKAKGMSTKYTDL